MLNETPQTVTLTQDQITDLTFENELIKGYIRVTKLSKEDNQYNGDIKGTRLENAKFEVYDKENNLVDTLITDKNGEATTKELLKGKYTLKEVESPDYYILTDEIFEAEIVNHQEIVDVEVENDNVSLDYTICAGKSQAYGTAKPAQQEIRFPSIFTLDKIRTLC